MHQFGTFNSAKLNKTMIISFFWIHVIFGTKPSYDFNSHCSVTNITALVEWWLNWRHLFVCFRYCSGCCVCPVHWRARNSDDLENFPLCWCCFHEYPRPAVLNYRFIFQIVIVLTCFAISFLMCCPFFSTKWTKCWLTKIIFSFWANL